MELKVVIDKKFAFMIFGAILILAGAIYGYAFGGNVPDVMGHSLGEIDIVKSYSCGSGKYIKSFNLEDGNVVCENDDVGGVPGVTTKTYGPYRSLSQTFLGPWVFCSLGRMHTGKENHGARVWKSGSNWYVKSAGFSDDRYQYFTVNCWKFS